MSRLSGILAVLIYRYNAPRPFWTPRTAHGARAAADADAAACAGSVRRVKLSTSLDAPPSGW